MEIQEPTLTLAIDEVIAEREKAVEGISDQKEIDAIDKAFESKITAAEKVDEEAVNAESDAAAKAIESEVSEAKARMAEDSEKQKAQLVEMESLGEAKAKEFADKQSANEALETVDMEALKDKYTGKQLKQLHKDNNIKGYSKFNEAELIESLLKNGIKL